MTYNEQRTLIKEILRMNLNEWIKESKSSHLDLGTFIGLKLQEQIDIEILLYHSNFVSHLLKKELKQSSEFHTHIIKNLLIH